MTRNPEVPTRKKPTDPTRKIQARAATREDRPTPRTEPTDRTDIRTPGEWTGPRNQGVPVLNDRFREPKERNNPGPEQPTYQDQDRRKTGKIQRPKKLELDRLARSQIPTERKGKRKNSRKKPMTKKREKKRQQISPKIPRTKRKKAQEPQEPEPERKGRPEGREGPQPDRLPNRRQKEKGKFDPQNQKREENLQLR